MCSKTLLPQAGIIQAPSQLPGEHTIRSFIRVIHSIQAFSYSQVPGRQASTLTVAPRQLHIRGENINPRRKHEIRGGNIKYVEETLNPWRKH